MLTPADPPTEPPAPVSQPFQLPAQLPAEVAGIAVPDEVFDRYAHLVRATLGVPVALVSLVTTAGQVFPGAEGLPSPWQQTRCTGLSHSFCQYVVARDAPLVITDAREDPEMAGNLAISDIGVIAYAGFPLHAADGTTVGSLCAIDTSPRVWSEHELDVLAHLAATASSELAMRAASVLAQDAVRAERAAAVRIAQVTESMAVAYLAMDVDWVITYVNAAAEQIAAAPRTQLVGRSFWEAFPAAVDTDFERHYRRAVATGETVTFDAFYPAPLQVWVQVRAVPEGEGLALYFSDVTDRYDAVAAAEHASAQLAALGSIALSLADAEEISDLVATIAEQGLAALGADGGSVAVPDPDDDTQLLSYITANFGEGTRADFGRLPMSAQLPVALAARSGQRVLLEDQAACVAMSAHVLAANEATGCQAWASVPLRAGAQVIGVLTAGWAQPQTFGPAQVALLETFAAQCAQALRRLQSRDAERLSAAAELRAGDLARTSAARQGALVTIAQALADADTQDEVLNVLAGQGADLLGANGCGICLRTDDGAHVDTVVTDSYADVRPTVQRTPADFPMPAVRAAATGQAFYLSDREQTEQTFPGSEAIYIGAGVQASAAVPLRTRGRLLGCLSVGFADPRVFSSEERELLTAFAALTAQALGRIAAHEAEQAALAAASSTAQILQRSMLTAPPEPDHLQIAVRYAASAAHAEVGGDWYDAFITADGVTSLVIGDVTGHDMRAASMMGQLRNLVRGVAFTLGESPARVLAAVDRAAAGLGIDTVATAILAQIEVDEAHRAAGTRLVRWSNAGHLPPLLLEADGTARFLEADSDLVLGWDPAVDRHDHEHVLKPGSTVLLYTDGLVERRGISVEQGLAWLAHAAGELASSPGGTVEQLCDGLVGLVGDHLDDDVALLALRAHPEDAPRPPEAGPVRVPARLEEAQAAAAAEADS
ncbi:GAF domain-containing protein [Quadrisphaera sp. KR29]|uniref:GAF domain-containing protein n=1 Tax=Quadrisphaera sp. KR29 TaxID=3461391 RepID=UPI004043A383